MNSDYTELAKELVKTTRCAWWTAYSQHSASALDPDVLPVAEISRALMEAEQRGAEEASQSNRISLDVIFGKNVKLNGFVNLYGCTIGDNTKVGPFVEIGKGAVIGANCKISSHTYICPGVTIEDEVFIGHNVTFINDRYPRTIHPKNMCGIEAGWVCLPILVKRGVSIGSGATILCGVTIGERAMVGAGSVVTKDVPPDATVVGNPARQIQH